LKIVIPLSVLLACLFYCLLSSNISAQSTLTANNEQYVKEEWTVENGLSFGHINQIYQTPDGYIWLATFNGLIRFDGLRFTLFDVSNTPELPSNRVVFLQPGQGSGFWLFTEQRDILYFENNHFKQYGPFLSFEHQRVLLDGDSLTWITSLNGLKKLLNDSLVPCQLGQLENQDVLSVFRSKNGELVVSTKEGSIYKTKYPYTQLSLITQLLEPNRSKNIIEDHAGNIWLFNDFMFKITDKKTLLLDQDKTTAKNWSGVSPLYFNLMEDNNGLKWTITETGFFQLTQSGFEIIEKYNHVSPEVSERQGAGMCKCSDGTVWTVVNKNVYKNGKKQFELSQIGATVFCDNEMNIWITNRINGFQRFSPSLLKSYKSEYSDNNFYGIFQDHAGKIWSGEWIKSLFSIDKNDLLIKEPLENAVGVTAAFAEDKRNNLYIGPYQVQNSTSKDAYGAKRLPGLPNEIFAIHPQNDSTIYFGALQGLYLYDGETAHQINDGNETPDFPVRQIVDAGKTNLWLATNGSGVRNYNYSTGQNVYYNTQNGLSSNNVRYVMAAADGSIWVATEDLGLNRINPETGEIVWIQKVDGLYDDGLHNMLLDNYNRLWMATNQGIFWVDFSDLCAIADGEIKKVRSTIYTERDGMPIREANGGFQNSALKTADGNLWFCTQNGIVRIDPAKIEKELTLLPVVIERINSGDSTLYLEKKTLVLAKNQQNLSIRFTTPTFLAPERLRFKYRLKGFDSEWVESGERREAIYTNLPAGNFTFQVTSFYQGDSLNASITEFSIIKMPLLSETWWFWILIAFGATLIIIAIIKWRFHRLKLQRQNLEAVVAIRTSDLEAEKRITESQKEKLQLLDQEKSRFFANISHEFRTPLTLILGPLRDLLTADNKSDLSYRAKKQIDTSLKNANRLMGLVDQLLDIARLEAKKLKLDLRPLEINDYVRDLAASFLSFAEANHILFKISIEQKPLFMLFDPLQLDKVVLNLLSNAFKYTPAGQEVSVDLKQENQKVVITISDTGRGIPSEYLTHLFERFFQIEKSEIQAGTGIGLSIAKELTEIHNGIIEVKSKLGEGTQFTLRFPLVAFGDKVKNAVVASKVGLDLGFELEETELDRDSVVTKTTDVIDKKIILVVDDNSDIRSYISDSFKETYCILEAQSGSEALTIIKNQLPDIIVSDVMMPNGDGLELLAHIRNEPEIAFLPVILLTAKAEVSDKLDGLKIGADDYLTKPFNITELKSRISNILLSRMRLQQHFSETILPEYNKIQSLPIDLLATDVDFINTLEQTIHQNFTDESFSVEKLASLMGNSRSNLYRKVMALTNESPSETLKRIRLEHAAQLLEQHVGNISEIAYASGFNSISHFSKSFKKAYGVSPTEYSQN